MTSHPHRTALPTFVAGGAAGCTAAVLTCPLEVIKTKLQSRNLARSSFVSVVRSTWLTEGYRGFFRGLVPLLSGKNPSAALARTLYVTLPSFRGSSRTCDVLFCVYFLQRKRGQRSREQPRRSHNCRRSCRRHLSDRVEPNICRENQTPGSSWKHFQIKYVYSFV